MMSTREFIQHLLLNCDLDDPVHIEVRVPEDMSCRFLTFEPAHACKLGNDDDDNPVTLIECKPWKELD